MLGLFRNEKPFIDAVQSFSNVWFTDKVLRFSEKHILIQKIFEC